METLVKHHLHESSDLSSVTEETSIAANTSKNVGSRILHDTVHELSSPVGIILSRSALVVSLHDQRRSEHGVLESEGFENLFVDEHVK